MRINMHYLFCSKKSGNDGAAVKNMHEKPTMPKTYLSAAYSLRRYTPCACS